MAGDFAVDSQNLIDEDMRSLYTHVHTWEG